MGDQLEQCILDVQKMYPEKIASLERNGMLYSIEVNEDNFTALEAFTGMWDRGVNVVTSSQHAPIFKLYPPLILDESHVAEFGDKFEDCVKNGVGGGHHKSRCFALSVGHHGDQ